MLTQEYHVAYFIGPNLLSGINVEANDEIHAMGEAYEIVTQGTRWNTYAINWQVCYVHARETNTLSMITADCFPVQNYFE